MAATAGSFARRLQQICSRSRNFSLNNTLSKHNARNFNRCIALGVSSGSLLATYFLLKSRNHRLFTNASGFPIIHARERVYERESVPVAPATNRERRFRQFASIEYEGSIYMTPQDFLESITEELPRPRVGRARLSKSDVNGLLRHTPVRSRASTKLFRQLHTQGMISYTEYLFLLCVLTKPQSGFRIAFNMFDIDGNQIVDKKEFLVVLEYCGNPDRFTNHFIQNAVALLESFFTLPPSERKFVPRKEKSLQALLSDAAESPNLERIFSSKSRTTADDLSGETDEDKFNITLSDTTLLIHFFGQKGTEVLRYEDFHRFMENLQSEVLELEFKEFSKGMPTISEVDFARILLRYTLLDRPEIEECIARVQQRIPQEKGISFPEFKQFCQFLNNLDDFAIAMKMFTFAEMSVSQDEFQRAVKVCTGFMLGPHVVNTVFQIFDADGDGNLSHKEFISIMKDRLHRGSRSHLMHTQNTWASFKSCVKTEMKSLY